MPVSVNSHKYPPRMIETAHGMFQSQKMLFVERRFGLSGFYKDQKEKETLGSGRDRNVDSF